MNIQLSFFVKFITHRDVITLLFETSTSSILYRLMQCYELFAVKQISD